ncbi:MFS transporter [Cellulomonas sp. SG140]|uniref:MFS transporter n=1 Tax=Cellulomonas sp. SG140 TaxID=2976536 RepID=UPI0021E6DB05|nr:MFS transporter [Cellulomonas sp. SG140]
MTSQPNPPAGIADAPVAPALPRRSTGTVLALCMSMLVAYWPFSVATGALALVARTTHATGATLAWVPDAFATAIAVAVLPAGALVARRGAAQVVRVGLALTAAGTVVMAGGLVAPRAALGAAWVGEGLAGVGAALAMTGSLVALSRIPGDGAARARRTAGWSAATVAGLGTGPFLVAAVVLVGDWRLVAAPVVLGALALVAALRSAGGDPASAGRRTPLVPTALFRSATFDLASLGAGGVLLVTVGIVVTVGLYLDGQHVGALGAATRLAAFFVANAVAGLLAGRLAAQVRPAALLVCGLALGTVGALSLATLDDGRFGPVALRLLVMGAGCGVVMATSPAVAVGSVPAALVPAAGGVSNAIRQTGAALGPIVFGTLLTAGTLPALVVHRAGLLAAAVLLLLTLACLPLLRSAAPQA